MTHRNFGPTARNYSTAQLSNAVSRLGSGGSEYPDSIKPGVLAWDTTAGALKPFNGTSFAALDISAPAPTITGAAFFGDLSVIRLSFNHQMSHYNVPEGPEFTFTVDGGDPTPAAGGEWGTDENANTFTVILPAPVDSESTVLLSYVKPTANYLRDKDGAAVATFANHATTFPA